MERAGYLLGLGTRPVPLHCGDTLTLGRDAQNHVPLNDALSSRRHAVIEVDERGVAFLKDLGSSNGTFLNDDNVKGLGRTQLRSGDEMRIGGTLFSYVTDDGTTEPRQLARKRSAEFTEMNTITADAGAVRKAMANRETSLTPRGATVPAGNGAEASREPPDLSGKLSEQNLAQVVQLLATNCRTGELRIQGDQRDGVCAFHEGRLFFAEAGVRKGEDAVYACALQADGRFAFRRSDAKPNRPENVTEPVMKIVFECCRKMDELNG